MSFGDVITGVRGDVIRACGASAHRRTGRRARKDTRGRRFVTFGDVITGVRGDVIRACGVT